MLLALPLTAGQTSGKIGASEVRAVKAAVTTLYVKDHDHGSAPLRHAASEALHTAYQWLQSGTYTSRTESKLRSATGALSIAAGWLSYDSGRAGDAHSPLRARSPDESPYESPHRDGRDRESSTSQARSRDTGRADYFSTRPPKALRTQRRTNRPTTEAALGDRLTGHLPDGGRAPR